MATAKTPPKRKIHEEVVPPAALASRASSPPTTTRKRALMIHKSIALTSHTPGFAPGLTSGRTGQLGREPVVELEQAFDDHLGLAEHGHEVGVAVPAGDDVPVEVPRQPRAGGAAEVQADVVALGLHHPVEDPDDPPERLDRPGQLRALQLVEPPPMHIRRHQ